MTGEQISRRQIAEQLRRCSRYDGRTLDPQTFEDWYTILGDLPAVDVEAAVTEHYRTSEKWIMPRHIVGYCERQVAARAIEAMRQNPPACWGVGCAVRYLLSERPGSRFAFPDAAHAADCNAMQGVLVFSGHGPSWGVNPGLDPGGFDEVEWEAAQVSVAAQMDRYQEIMGGDPEYGHSETEKTLRRLEGR